MVRELHYHPLPGRAYPASSGRELAAALLRRASQMLARMALSVAGAASPMVARESVSDPVLEFYAEAGAPEGALYVDGELVGMLVGVTRL
ncbi:MAG: hypothetical protein JNJ89_14490 [Rubrivivax sp.]|nr:hypothetical protein [Rubrivivax sp.]